MPVVAFWVQIPKQLYFSLYLSENRLLQKKTIRAKQNYFGLGFARTRLEFSLPFVSPDVRFLPLWETIHNLRNL